MKQETKWPIWMFWLGIFVLSALLTWNNALTTSADLIRNEVSHASWEPYVWEYSSLFSFLLLYFAVYWLANKAPLMSQNWLPHLVIHMMASVLFSVLHVLLMVGFRQITYAMVGGQYEFGDWFTELLYEYRKDVITYFLFILILYAFQYFSQAKPVESKNFQLKNSENQKFQVKNKQGIFWLNYTDIITIESGGNYVYIHANDKVFPMRSTMAKIELQLDTTTFVRVHRSYVVNLNHCKGLQKPSNDSSELLLLNGKVVPVSKKYRPELLAALAQKLS